MTIEELKKQNPWRKIAEEIKQDGYKLLRGKYILKEDKAILDEFNKCCQDKKEYQYQYRLHLAPEPFFGNPLKAKVIILGLNPGYKEDCNDKAFNRFPVDKQKRFIKERCSDMSLADDSKLHIDDEVTNTIGECYWKENLKEILAEIGEEKIADKIALVQYIGYFSKTHKDFYKDKYLYSQKFTIELIEHIVEENKPVIVITRPYKGKYKESIWYNKNKKWYEAVPCLEQYEGKVILNSPRCLAISRRNCGEDGFEKIMEALRD
jgi:hypothetical protein